MSKLGSDLKETRRHHVLRPEDYERLVWPLPAADLLYVGRATEEKLRRVGITTIGGIAQASPHLLKTLLGINGEMLWRFATGQDKTPWRTPGIRRS
jgi:DNA polymerase-4